ncbi:MAG TPA: hypothetical protein VNS09_11825 [Solirubrobacter sp.]|nr:hypothetical protein [Solirubrobacter sp.]
MALLAAGVAASPASAAGNGWSCISPFANYTNGTYPDDPPAPDRILDSLAISVTRADDQPLRAVAGQRLPLRDLRLRLKFTDTRPAEQMYRRTGGITLSYSSVIPYTQVDNTTRTLAKRVNPDDNQTYWSYTASGATVYVQQLDAANPDEPPKVRDAATPANTTWYYAAPTPGLGHRYLSHTGNSQFPLDAWVTVAASNTVEGVQTLPVKGYWTINIQDATPGTPANPANYNNDEVVATVPEVVLDLPRTDWTPTGAGPVEFTVAEPRQMGVIQVESKGYDRVGYNAPLNVRPFGSVYVRAQTEAYGASNDCIPGAISLVDASINPSSQAAFLFADADPVTPDPELGSPGTPGQYLTQSGLQNVTGQRGRYGFAFTPAAPIATAALGTEQPGVNPTPTPAPVATPAPAATPAPTADAPVKVASGSKLKPSRTGTVKLKLTNPNAGGAKYRVSIATTSKYRVGKSKRKRTITVASAKTVTLEPGASTVSVKLSSTARKLLKQRKSLKVKLTLKPAAGGSPVTATLTLKS